VSLMDRCTAVGNHTTMAWLTNIFAKTRCQPCRHSTTDTTLPEKVARSNQLCHHDVLGASSYGRRQPRHRGIARTHSNKPPLAVPPRCRRHHPSSKPPPRAAPRGQGTERSRCRWAPATSNHTAMEPRVAPHSDHESHRRHWLRAPAQGPTRPAPAGEPSGWPPP
jgi:hypothetical protein